MSRCPPSRAIWALPPTSPPGSSPLSWSPTASACRITGWLMNRYGVVQVFVLSVLGFTLASLLCGLAWSLESLVFFRALQGALSGPIIPGSQALMLSIFPARQAHHGAGDLVHHHPGGADLRPHPGRLYFRFLALGLDIPDQCAGGAGGGRAVLGQSCGERETATAQAADRCGGAGASDRLGRRAAGDAGHRQECRLVWIHPDHRAGGGGGGRLRAPSCCGN